MYLALSKYLYSGLPSFYEGWHPSREDSSGIRGVSEGGTTTRMIVATM